MHLEHSILAARTCSSVPPGREPPAEYRIEATPGRAPQMVRTPFLASLVVSASVVVLHAEAACELPAVREFDCGRCGAASERTLTLT